jgi:hypothetical protein
MSFARYQLDVAFNPRPGELDDFTIRAMKTANDLTSLCHDIGRELIHGVLTGTITLSHRKLLDKTVTRNCGGNWDEANDRAKPNRGLAIISFAAGSFLWGWEKSPRFHWGVGTVFRGYYLESQSVGMVPRGNFTKGVAMKLLRMRNVLAVHLALVVAGKALEAGEEAESIWQVGAVIDCQPSHGGWDPVFDEPLFYELDLRTPEGEVFTAVVFTFQLRQLEQICNQLVKPGVRVEFMWWQPFWFEKVFLMSKILPLPELAGPVKKETRSSRKTARCAATLTASRWPAKEVSCLRSR